MYYLPQSRRRRPVFCEQPWSTENTRLNIQCFKGNGDFMFQEYFRCKVYQQIIWTTGYLEYASTDRFLSSSRLVLHQLKILVVSLLLNHSKIKDSPQYRKFFIIFFCSAKIVVLYLILFNRKRNLEKINCQFNLKICII